MSVDVVEKEEKVFEFYEVLPPEVRSMVIDGMQPDDKCTFANCSKKSNMEAKDKVTREDVYQINFYCTICDKPTALDTNGSRWNLLRHVKLHHSECKPYKCSDCDFIGTKGNVIKHAVVSQHQAHNPLDITTDAMHDEWEMTVRKCFPDYFRMKKRVYQPESDAAPEVVPKLKIKSEAAPEIVPKVSPQTEAAIEVVPSPIRDVDDFVMLHDAYCCLPF